MGLFSRKPVATGTFRVLTATPMVGVGVGVGVGTMVLNGVPQQRVHVTGLVETTTTPPEATAVEAHFPATAIPTPGAVLPAEVLRASPLKIRVQWTTPRSQQEVRIAQQDAAAQVVADLATGARLSHEPGQSDPLGIAFTDEAAPATIADQLAAVLGTPISVDTDIGGALTHRTVNSSSHLSSAGAAQLLSTGTSATATITAATRVPVPQAMLPGPDASLWDLTLEVHRTDGTSYTATTRVGFRTEARRAVIGTPGLTIPVRTDPNDDTRVALDSTTFNQQHPEDPPG